MLEDLLQNNKLEYINIDTYRSINIIKAMTISTNIQNMRYFFIDNSSRLDITLDISNEYPNKLLVY